MESSQHTLKESISLSGIGLHSGYKVKLNIKPARANNGIRFKLIGRKQSMPALVDRVIDTSLATTIADKDMVFSTTEHILGALSGLGIDNATIELDAPEVPIMDGSAEEFVRLLQSANRKTQQSKRLFLKIIKEITYEEGDKKIRILPHNGLRLSCRIDFAHGLIQNQSYSIDISPKSFSTEIASARTFGFLDQVKQLQANGYALGGSLNNAVVVDENGVMNEEGLRFKDEFVRHKVLDLLGDLSLLGYPLLGHVIAERSGHSQHFGLMKELAAHPECWQIVELNKTNENGGMLERIVSSTKNAGIRLRPFWNRPVSSAATCPAAA
ncbi:MAG TPA: UDP-3-O-acyl-N-acetylglucosamine deacetylase [Desulfobacterales bacterium]|nr:UDP-3-O-acyl-N-acetylglucosamine deacetylase [Desulfobacterales bacterium]